MISMYLSLKGTPWARLLRRGLYEVVRVTLIEAFAASLPADA
jgi:hypothetical protein